MKPNTQRDSHRLRIIQKKINPIKEGVNVQDSGDVEGCKINEVKVK
jgi:hypothetical protein